MDQDHPEELDQPLVDALHEGPLKDLEYGRESVSSLVLLYLFMKLSRPGVRLVKAEQYDIRFMGLTFLFVTADLALISRPVLPSP